MIHYYNSGFKFYRHISIKELISLLNKNKIEIPEYVTEDP